jgi:cyclophilin family peptidyl-prolyl cis-trans isomerase/HEAT repeat protein
MSLARVRVVAVATALAAGLAAAATPPNLVARASLLAVADSRHFDKAYLSSFVHQANPEVRAAAARVLGGLGNPAAISLLNRLAGDPEAGVRAAVAEAAGRLSPDLVPADARHHRSLEALLRRLLVDRDPQVREAAAWGIGKASLEKGGRYLVDRLRQEPEVEVRAALLRELWRTRGAEWIGTAAATLNSPEVEVRFAAAWSLSRSDDPLAAGPLRQAARDPQPQIRLVALTGAQRGRRAAALWDELCVGVEDVDAGVRIAALAGLDAELEAAPGRRLPAKVISVVTARVRDRDPERVDERVEAIRVAGAAGVAGDALHAALAGGEAWVAGEALAALARSGAPGIASQVDQWLTSADTAQQVAAVDAVRFLPDARARLAKLQEDSESGVRVAAIDALEHLGGPEALALVEKKLSDPDPVVRAAAIEACRQLGWHVSMSTLLELLDKEKGASAPDAAVGLVEAVGRGFPMPPEARRKLEKLLKDPDPVVARVAWSTLRHHGVRAELPLVHTGQGPRFYRQVEEWASADRWLEVVTVRGTMQVALDTETAPLAAYRISALAEKKFFDGLTFHRVVPDYVVQGGDPRGDGWGGPGFTLRDELALVPFAAGSVGLALAGPDTGGSQIFVTLNREPHLEGRYPHLGEVVAGLDVARRLRRGDHIVRVRPGKGGLPQYYPVWYGVIDPARLDAEIPGWRDEREHYKPNRKVLERLASASQHYGLTVALGTWCSDSREQIPRLQAILAALGPHSPFGPPLLLGIDRSRVVYGSRFPYGEVDLVPTIVVTLEGAEVGRIVETPISSSLEQDLVHILAPIEGWPEQPTPAPTPPA